MEEKTRLQMQRKEEVMWGKEAVDLSVHCSGSSGM